MGVDIILVTWGAICGAVSVSQDGNCSVLQVQGLGDPAWGLCLGGALAVLWRCLGGIVILHRQARNGTFLMVGWQWYVRL